MNLLKEFQELKNGSQFVVGTNQQTRSIVWNSFVEAFPDMVVITLDGVDVHLTANKSVGGKSTAYWGELSREQYKHFVGSVFGLKKCQSPTISIQGGVIEISGGGKFYCKISNSRITNLLPF